MNFSAPAHAYYFSSLKKWIYLTVVNLIKYIFASYKFKMFYMMISLEYDML